MCRLLPFASTVSGDSDGELYERARVDAYSLRTRHLLDGTRHCAIQLHGGLNLLQGSVHGYEANPDSDAHTLRHGLALAFTRLDTFQKALMKVILDN